MLNRAAADALQTLQAGSVHACTDITGFGLIGHGTEMAAASGVTLEIDAGKVPVFSGVIEIARQNRSGGMTSNEEHFGGGALLDKTAGEDLLSLLFDPQTSGGLLVAAAAGAGAEVARAFEQAGVRAVQIGRARAKTPGIHIDVRA